MTTRTSASTDSHSVFDGTRRLVTTITAFTIAHSITLALASLGVLHVPGPPVEALIALSIVFVAAEIVHGRQGRPGLTQRYPWIVAFTFGLLHGLGFAGALAEVGLPHNSIPLALLFFNVGVEIGQLLFIGAVLALIAGGTRLAAALRLRPAPDPGDRGHATQFRDYNEPTHIADQWPVPTDTAQSLRRYFLLTAMPGPDSDAPSCSVR